MKPEIELLLKQHDADHKLTDDNIRTLMLYCLELLAFIKEETRKVLHS